jgi:hypothetical protein
MPTPDKSSDRKRDEFEPVSIPPKMDPVSTPAAAVNPALTSPAEPKYEIPKGTRAGSKPHLAPDAKFTIVHPCSRTCHAGQTGVGREAFRPMAVLDNDAMERETNSAIERLMRLGAIVHEPDAE